MGKKDFSGKNKTSKTYDEDWVFHSGAWVTKRQRRQDIANQKEAKRYIHNLRAGEEARNKPAAAAGTPPATAPILGGPSSRPATDTGLTPEPRPATAALSRTPIGNIPVPVATNPRSPIGSVSTPRPDHPLGVEPQYSGAPVPRPGGSRDGLNPPSWWINQAIKNPTDPNQQFANVANALLPTLAPEDQRTLATYLATNFKDVYGGYANVNFGRAPTEITPEMRQQYLSPQRAQLALTLLNKMQKASGAKNMGAGYNFLKNAVGLINQFATQGAMRRENYSQFTNAVSSLVGQASNDKSLAAYANLAQLFNLPKFSAGPLVSNTPNSKLFG